MAKTETIVLGVRVDFVVSNHDLQLAIDGAVRASDTLPKGEREQFVQHAQHLIEVQKTRVAMGLGEVGNGAGTESGCAPAPAQGEGSHGFRSPD